jgi:hypothetical protein
MVTKTISSKYFTRLNNKKENKFYFIKAKINLRRIPPSLRKECRTLAA